MVLFGRPYVTLFLVSHQILKKIVIECEIVRTGKSETKALVLAKSLCVCAMPHSCSFSELLQQNSAQTQKAHNVSLLRHDGKQTHSKHTHTHTQHRQTNIQKNALRAT